MKNRDFLGWLVIGINWYVILVIGGLITITLGLYHRFYDLWLLARKEPNESKYHISKSPKKLLTSFVTLFLGFIINILIITLILPILMGLQHLSRKIFSKNISVNFSKTAFKDMQKWYDGIIYASGVDPSLKDVRAKFFDLVPEKSEIIDICCGTGELVFLLAKKCKKVVGIDHSSKMINYAKNEKSDRGIANVEFFHMNAVNLSEFTDKQFDQSVLSLTLHEMPPNIRADVLKEAKRISKQIMILDYAIPAPMNVKGINDLFYEFVAGYDHLKNYLHYRDKGGLVYFLNEVGITIDEESFAHKGTLTIVKAK